MKYFFDFFSKGRLAFPPGSAIPREWIEVRFKSYPHLPQLKLPAPAKIKIPLDQIILTRKSERKFSGASISLKDLSGLLFYSGGIVAGERNLSRRVYPSGGGRYPLEIYLLIYRAQDFESGIYHYNVKNHGLELLTSDNEDLGESKKAFSADFLGKASMIIIITSVPERSSVKYGNNALKFSLIEAGHLAQNFYLVSKALGLKCCALGSIEANLMNRLLDIDGNTEIPFYSLVFGK